MMYRKLGIAAAGVAAVLLMTACAGHSTNGDEPVPESSGTPSASAVPTSSPKESGQPAASSSAAPSASSSANGASDLGSAGSDGTMVFLSSADLSADGTAVEMAGFVQGVVADGGTCRYSLAKGKVSQTVEVTGVADVSKTSCPWGSVPLSALASGTWTVTLTYVPTGAVSQSVAVKVP